MAAISPTEDCAGVNDKPAYTFRVVLLGKGAAGMTNLVRGISCGFPTPSNIFISLGVEFCNKSYAIDDKTAKLIIFDVNGCSLGYDGHRMKRPDGLSFASIIYKNTNGILLVYDITNEESFEYVQEWWTKEIKDNIPDHTVTMLLGNKSDLESHRVVSYERGRMLAGELGMKFMEVSARTGSCVEEALLTLTRDMIRTRCILDNPQKVVRDEEEDSDTEEVEVEQNEKQPKPTKCRPS